MERFIAIKGPAEHYLLIDAPGAEVRFRIQLQGETEREARTLRQLHVDHGVAETLSPHPQKGGPAFDPHQWLNDLKTSILMLPSEQAMYQGLSKGIVIVFAHDALNALAERLTPAREKEILQMLDVTIVDDAVTAEVPRLDTDDAQEADPLIGAAHLPRARQVLLLERGPVSINPDEWVVVDRGSSGLVSWVEILQRPAAGRINRVDVDCIVHGAGYVARYGVRGTLTPEGRAAMLGDGRSLAQMIRDVVTGLGLQHTGIAEELLSRMTPVAI